MAEETLVEAGTIAGTHGLRGDLKVRPNTNGSQVLFGAECVTLFCKDGRQLTIDVVKTSMHKQIVLLTLEGYDHIDKVEGFLGAKVFMAYEQFPQLEDGCHYWHQLQGLQVVDSQLGDLGSLTSVLETSGHDVYVAEGCHGEVMFPAVEAFIDEIDLEQGQMRVTLPDGLIELNG
ncbi:MAG: 16S rRNA processing protein RimM [Deltaproteobacteria bacterium]|nr:16S rRNA processing protein RimM [Deltaproteobacteria bacterium]